MPNIQRNFFVKIEDGEVMPQMHYKEMNKAKPAQSHWEVQKNVLLTGGTLG